jgi:hypothetical protein
LTFGLDSHSQVLLGLPFACYAAYWRLAESGKTE